MTNILKEFIQALPKTEIHIHCEATVSFNSYCQLNQKYGVNPLLKVPQDFCKLLQINSLSEMIKNFFFLQSLFKNSEDYMYVVHDVADYAARNNIYYVEAFIAPSLVLRQGTIDFAGIMDPLIEGFSAIHSQGGVDVRLIVDVSRSFGVENAKTNLSHLLGYLKTKTTDRILGIGLGGKEEGNPCAPYKDVFVVAREAGLHTVAHAGEELGHESILDAVKVLQAERIGHATSAIQDESVMQLLQDMQIPIEVCPTSNIVTGKYYQQFEKHPIKDFIARGLNVTLNTDDPVLFNIELNEEYYKVANLLGITSQKIVSLLENNIRATFMPTHAKQVAIQKLATALQKH